MFNKKIKFIFITFCAISLLSSSGFGQTNPNKKNNRTTDSQTKEERDSTKKNSRPTEDGRSGTQDSVAKNPVYFYEFSRPEFLTSKIIIEHDENGIGQISFLKKDFQEAITDPLRLSTATLEKLKTYWQTLNFLDSNEDYQYEKDYSHLGNVKIKMAKDGRERMAEFNWTTNKDAKALMDEYRKISNQYIWMFDINVSRENQPLESPRMMNSLDSMLRRNEISDANQMIPFLKELGDDERIPLISRNHATRLIIKIEKQIEKDKEKN